MAKLKPQKIKATRETSKRFEEISTRSKALPGNRVHEIKELNPQRKKYILVSGVKMLCS